MITEAQLHELVGKLEASCNPQAHALACALTGCPAGTPAGHLMTVAAPGGGLLSHIDWAKLTPLMIELLTQLLTPKVA